MTEPQLTTLAARPAAKVADQEINVVTLEESRCGMASYNRRDLFKVILVVEGANELHYATRSYAVDRPALVFTNRLVPYSWEPVEGTAEQQGYICAFTEAFLQAAMRGVSLKESVLYRVDGNPVYLLQDSQLRYLTEAFGRMREDLRTDYAHKHDLLRNQLSIIIHEATRLQPASAYPAPANAAERLAKLFLTLLDNQFPVTTQQHEPLLKKASEYADRMAVHVNHLNAALKEVTGKSTTEHLNDRLVTEAKLLLTDSDWNVSEIAYSLGFEYASYFTNFFKKHTGYTPLAYRRDV
jgi:AraC family transcriptional activator of pobA